MRKSAMVAAAGLVILAVSACVNVKAPERIDIGGDPVYGADDRSAPGTPDPKNMDEARVELRKAYREIDRLRRQNRDLEQDKRKLKDERDEYKDKYKRLKDRDD